jgi:hypothetical protein
LVTSNTRHLSPEVARCTGLKIGTPKQVIEHIDVLAYDAAACVWP